MNTYFVKGISCEAFIGSQTWQQSVAQELIIDLEFRLAADQNTSNFMQGDQKYLENSINGIIEVITSKHWPSLHDIAEQLKKHIQLHIRAEYFQIKVVIPHAFSQVESIALVVQFPE